MVSATPGNGLDSGFVGGTSGLRPRKGGGLLKSILFTPHPKTLLIKYFMRIFELVLKLIKPKPPMSLAQARLDGLKQRVDKSKQQLQTERDRQRQQRDNERIQKKLRPR